MTGLRWGGYVGSPADAVEPRLVLNEKLGAERIVAVTDDEIFALTSSSCVITYQRKPGTIYGENLPAFFIFLLKLCDVCSR